MATDKLSRVLINLGLDDEADLDEFKYAGGDKREHLNYFKLLFGKDAELLPHAEHCVCGHKITENCYVSDASGTLYPIGNCCIKQFMKKSGRTCEACGKPHKNRTDNFCHACRFKNEKKQPLATITYNNECLDCGMECGKFLTCYACNNKSVVVNLCSDCGKACGTYKKCYGCNNKHTIKSNNICKCGKACKTFKTCWNCK